MLRPWFVLAVLVVSACSRQPDHSAPVSSKPDPVIEPAASPKLLLSSDVTAAEMLYRRVVSMAESGRFEDMAALVHPGGLQDGDGIVTAQEFRAQLADPQSRIREWLTHGRPQAEASECRDGGKAVVPPVTLARTAPRYEVKVLSAGAAGQFTVTGHAQVDRDGVKCSYMWPVEIAVEPDGNAYLELYLNFLGG